SVQFIAFDIRFSVLFQSALFNFHSFLTVILLGICACTYFKMQFPAILDQKTGLDGMTYMLS
ncbi:Protein kish-A isoform C, partial [Glycine soja]